MSGTQTLEFAFEIILELRVENTAAAVVAAAGASSGTGGCPTGWILDGSQCYKIDTTPKTWADAKTACVADGGNLATVTTDGNVVAIVGMIHNYNNMSKYAWNLNMRFLFMIKILQNVVIIHRYLPFVVTEFSFTNRKYKR